MNKVCRSGEMITTCDNSHEYYYSIFDDHGGSNGIVSIGYAPFAFYGRNVFSGNSGTGSLTVRLPCLCK